jgi:hypothetical protein
MGLNQWGVQKAVLDPLVKVCSLLLSATRINNCDCSHAVAQVWDLRMMRALPAITVPTGGAHGPARGIGPSFVRFMPENRSNPLVSSSATAVIGVTDGRFYAVDPNSDSVVRSM